MTDGTTATNSPAGRGSALTALITGVLSLLALIIFFTTVAGAWLLATACALGVVGIVSGIIGIRQRVATGWAVTGLVTGILSVLLSAAIYLFALLFIGAFV